MAARASALAQSLAECSDEDILQALALLISNRPHLQGPIADLMQTEPPKRYTGVISAFYEHRRFGFIKCDEITAEYGTDTFLSDQELGFFTAGSAVNFSVAINKDGKPQARLLEQAEFQAPSFPTALSGHTAMAAHRPAPTKRVREATPTVVLPPKVPRLIVPPTGAGGASGVLPPPPTSNERRYVGVISAFYPQKKFGFIQCDHVTQEYGADTFLSDKEICSFAVDSIVSFKVAVNAKGQPQARDLLDASAVPSADMANSSGLFTGTEDPLSKRYVGCIHHFVADRRYGFIACDDVKTTFGMDTFLSNKEIGHFNNDDWVSFGITMNAQGKPQAHDLAPIADGSYLS